MLVITQQTDWFIVNLNTQTTELLINTNSMYNPHEVLKKLNLWIEKQITDEELEDYLDLYEAFEITDNPDHDLYVEKLIDKANTFFPGVAVDENEIKLVCSYLREYLETGKMYDI